jgi:hypothetical protein
MRNLIATIANRWPKASHVVLFIAAMAGLKFVFAGVIQGFGHWGFWALIAGLFAAAMWWEKHHPEEL